jgi:hypothetical protein
LAVPKLALEGSNLFGLIVMLCLVEELRLYFKSVHH